MASFKPHTITFTADTTLRGDEIKDYIVKKLHIGRIRVNADTITAEKQKKPRKTETE